MGNEWISLGQDLYKALLETALMVGVSSFFAIAGGVPLGFLLFAADRKFFWDNRFVQASGNFLVNLIRSVPFVILLVVLLPFTQIVLGTTIGPAAAAVPLSVAAIAFYARLVQGALYEVDPGIIEAAQAFGASPARILGVVLFREALPGFLRGLTVTLVSLVGYSAMAGIVGGGGIGDLAIRFGYYRYQSNVMFITVIVLVVLVQIIQSVGDRLADHSDRKGI
jgi:D-methionine transport system permease protein